MMPLAIGLTTIVVAALLGYIIGSGPRRRLARQHEIDARGLLATTVPAAVQDAAALVDRERVEITGFRFQRNGATSAWEVDAALRTLIGHGLRLGRAAGARS